MKKSLPVIIAVIFLSFSLLSLIAVPLINPQNIAEFNETIVSTWNHYGKRDVDWNDIPLSEEEKLINHTYYNSAAVSDLTEIVYCKWLEDSIMAQDTFTIHDFENSNGYSFSYMKNAIGDTFTVSSYYYDSLDLDPFNYDGFSEYIQMARQSHTTDCPCKQSVGIYSQDLDNDLMLVHPNPVNDFFFILLSTENFHHLEGKIMHLDGREVEQFSLDSSTDTKINTAHLSSGVYVVSLTGKNGVAFVEKIIIQH